MKGRQSVWSDERVIELAKKFVPCTDEVYRLQMDDDPDCKFFQSLAEQGHFAGKRFKSKQGTYICSADGTFLGSVNSVDPVKVLDLMNRGLEKLNSLPNEKKISFDESKLKANFRWQDSFPVDGLVVAIHSRDLPEDFSAKADRDVKWNRDTAWFTKDEVLKAIPDNAKVGMQSDLPNVLVQRLATMHFVDNVRGQTDPFGAAEAKGSKITCTVTKVDKNQIEFKMIGSTATASKDTRHRRTPRGVATKLKGSASFSKSKNRFERFDMLAIGYRWGKTRFNGRHRGPNSNSIGFAVSLAPENEAPNVPGLIYAYNVDWIKRSR